MATGSILLPIGAVVSRTGQPSNLGPAMQRVKSSATAPAPYFLQLALDAANLESAQPWQALRQLVEHRPGEKSPSRSGEL